MMLFLTNYNSKNEHFELKGIISKKGFTSFLNAF